MIRSGVIYLAFVVALRVFGKREVGQFTLFDLVFLLLVANAVQPAMTGPDSSLTGGLIIIATLVALNYGVARLDRYPFFQRLVRDQPTVIIEDGAFIEPAMGREGVAMTDCQSAIREHGLADVGEVKLGVLEPDGNISIVGYEGRRGHPPLRRRQVLRRVH